MNKCKSINKLKKEKLIFLIRDRAEGAKSQIASLNNSTAVHLTLQMLRTI